MKYRLLFTLILSLFSLMAWSQNVQFYARTNAKTVVPGTQFKVQYVIKNGRSPRLIAPSFKGFDYIGGPDKSIQETNVNGQWSYTIIYTYYLRAKGVGKYTIARANAQIDGKAYRAAPLSIEVVPGKKRKANPKKTVIENDPGPNGSEDLYFKVEIDTLSGHVGQQFILDYKIYTTIDIEDAEIKQDFDVEGIFAREIKEYRGETFLEVVNGIQYNTVILRRLALFPQKNGQYVLPNNQAIIAIPTGKVVQDFVFSRREVIKRKLESKSLNLKIEEFPKEGKDSIFNGMVGEFSMDAILSQTTLSTDDAFTLRMTLQGDGDAKRMLAPTLYFGEEFEVYDPSATVREEVINGKIITTKIFDYLVLPLSAGEFNITPTVQVFDSKSYGYKSLKTEPFKLSISKGKNPKARQINERDEELLNKKIKPIKEKSILQVKNNSIVYTPYFWIGILTPLLICLIALLIRIISNNKAPVDQRIKQQASAAKVAQKELQKVKEFIDKKEYKSAYQTIQESLVGYLSHKLITEKGTLSKEKIATLLAAKNVNEITISNTKQCLKNCEMALYAPASPAAAQQAYEQTLQLITDLENQL